MNRAKQKGTQFESAVCDYLRANGFPKVERRALCGNADRGDVGGIPGWVLELKAHKALDVAGAVDEAQREAVNDGSHWWAAILKRRNKSIAKAYVVMDLEQFAKLLR